MNQRTLCLVNFINQNYMVNHSIDIERLYRDYLFDKIKYKMFLRKEDVKWFIRFNVKYEINKLNIDK